MQQLREAKYCHISFLQFGGNFIFIFVATLLTGLTPMNMKHYTCPHLKIWSLMLNILCVRSWNSKVQYVHFTSEKHYFIVYFIMPSITTAVGLSQCTGSHNFLTKAIE